MLSCWIIMMTVVLIYYWYDVINANKIIHNELVLLVCFSTVDNMNHRIHVWSNLILVHYKKSVQFHIFIIELQYQYLNYITGIQVLYKIFKKIHNTGTNFYTSIVHNTSKPVLRLPSTGDPKFTSKIKFLGILKIFLFQLSHKDWETFEQFLRVPVL